MEMIIFPSWGILPRSQANETLMMPQSPTRLRTNRALKSPARSRAARAPKIQHQS
jgi:hypothetical protein